MPVGGVRVGDDPSTSVVPLVDQSRDGVQTLDTLHVGSTDAGATEGTGQIGIREVTTTQILS